MRFKKEELVSIIVNCYVLEQQEMVKEYMRTKFR